MADQTLCPVAFADPARGFQGEPLEVLAKNASAAALSSLRKASRSKPGLSGLPTKNPPKVDEKAYKAALDRIPVPTATYDPWGGARATD
ncbi:hypothetical protein [Bradyrhizobium sp. BR13661]|uniref:hypothetical protein n=1 Tax=Bradyrhizobium sp. BR13661 TaxID=2940622 RepID=UPI0024750DF5|nr:hypothetical protein [Bradyrhizobium sp. BR13661]MDH6258504.1 hypothetical protein [Bradyrhizobium sp. BR13661]